MQDADAEARGGCGPRRTSEDKQRAAAAASELRETYQHFRRNCSGYKQYHELQTVLWLAGEQLVGREVRVLWPDEEAWFCGRVTRYDEETGRHTVEYDDGDVEHLHLAAEEVRLQVVPGEAEAGLAPQPPAALQRTAACMAADAARLRERATELQSSRARTPSGAAQTEEAQTEDPQELIAKGSSDLEMEAAGSADCVIPTVPAEVPAEPSLPADWDSLQVLRPGEVVWAQLVCVRFFGDHTVYALPAVGAGQRVPDRGGALPFLAGLELGWHWRGAPTATASSHSQRFQRALFELRTYMTDGELPRGMIPPNYDEEDDEEGEDQGCSGGDANAGTAKGSGGNRSAAAGGYSAAALGTVTLPLTLGPKLQVLALGEIIWLSRWFHDEKYIYPVGYKAVRLMASGASGGREVRHVMEVLASEDGVRPVFSITPEGRPAVTADTATRAMRALFEDDALARGRAFAKTGVDLFGLSLPRVAALVRALPGADRCERFANWPDQDKPPLPPLSPYEELQRRALYARSLRLPPGVESVPHTKSGMCFECEVCGEDEESPDDLKLECDMCRCVVHSRCYGVKQPPHGALWLCDVCQLHATGLPAERAPPCELCPVLGGAMKRTESGGYVHLLCAMWTPGVFFGDPDTLEPVGGVAKAVQNRASLRCSLCKQQHGACIQCAGGARCYTAFHPMCAREAGLAMCELRQRPKHGRGARAATDWAAGRGAAPSECGDASGEAAPPSKAEEEKENKLAQPGSAGAAAAAEADGPCEAAVEVKPSVLVTGAKAASEGAAVVQPSMAAVAATSTAAQRRSRGRGRSSTSGHAALAAALQRGACRGGVSLGNGMSLVCICPRHEDIVLQQMHFRTSYPGGRFAERRAELIREQLRARRQQLLTQEEENERSQPVPLPPAQQSDACGAAAAEGPADGGQATAAAAGSARAASFADWRSRGHRAPEAVAIAREKRTFVKQLPYLVTGRLQQEQTAVEAVHCSSKRPAAASEEEQAAGGAECDAVAAGRAGASGGGGSSLPAPVVAAASAAGIQSVAERYAAMRATVGQRLAAGKSAIHGWGAFAKVPHKRGDMMIEYAGELIRPIVSDVREKRVYDKLVGCGTYIFNLNEQQHIDATRAGNLAHLLNHSCDPNCYSRTITLLDPATGVSRDHVIITAKRYIEAWEELTYDYRFNSSVELPCNCGAAKCRLLVNWPEQPRDEDGDQDAGGDEEGEGDADPGREGPMGPPEH
ncbi:hypothetical protein GPECTOR_12g558 [Gonium pectorale]|uniref:Histone-lysine N-methyltransferase n=1 Tax=Gonium pectorale TaxID=33097 RepID=A0A150GP65_GONPE|nr:hypothetical protein GPECTOR_12g558 [Gonium pectorale]|eukprot:KXZ51594.1 hypothetical protein GPECTOR_12g558 [Gonium pectorale]